MVHMKDTRDGGQGNCWEVLIFGTYLDSTLAGRLGVGNEGWRNQWWPFGFCPEFQDGWRMERQAGAEKGVWRKRLGRILLGFVKSEMPISQALEMWSWLTQIELAWIWLLPLLCPQVMVASCCTTSGPVPSNPPPWVLVRLMGWHCLIQCPVTGTSWVPNRAHTWASYNFTSIISFLAQEHSVAPYCTFEPGTCALWADLAHRCILFDPHRDFKK